MTLLTKVLIGALLVLAVGFGIQTWRVSAGKHDAVEAAVAPAKEQAAAAKVEEQQAGATLAARVDTVKRWLHDTVRVPVRVPEHVLHPVTPADTAAAVAALPIVQQQYESCRAQLTSLLTDCEAFHLKADRRASADSVVIVKQDALLRERPPKRYWHVGVTGGYGATLSGGQVVTGPSLTVGVTWTPF
jgi:hypothetical protein